MPMDDLVQYQAPGSLASFHAQTAVSFWKLAYEATWTSQGPRIPALRTEARELGMLATRAGPPSLRRISTSSPDNSSPARNRWNYSACRVFPAAVSA